MRGLLKWSLALSTLGLAAAAQAGVAWDESGAAGDLSNNRLLPTLVTLLPGPNEIHGLTGNAGSGVDRDYFSVDVPVGTILSSLILLADTNVSGGSSFIGIQVGPQITVTPEGAGAEALLGFSHYTNDMVGQNLLALIGQPGGLAAGRYSFWVQDTGGPASYGMDFELNPVPLPAAAWLLMSGLAGFATLRRSRNRALSSS